ncbi:tRNA methyl transferase family protein [Populus alba x Populus x berolinensis]|uniref:tRNA methyl transferase family protein n=1 Tax=Populus alba x Populus x berolinensis TaxID=444605 RepID=A0AAD6QAA1_9ROSI|nr:tRNA methyl transferase family protein [Populus alba x Populus x berolinensis]
MLKTFRVGSLRWLSGSPPDETNQLSVRKREARHGPALYDCRVKVELGAHGHEEVAVVHLCEDDQGLEAGQFTAFYQRRTCIGSGVILEAWDDQGFSVCQKALELARLEDKSKLGKPVKVRVKPETSGKESVQKDGIELDRVSAENPSCCHKLAKGPRACLQAAAGGGFLEQTTGNVTD